MTDNGWVNKPTEDFYTCLSNDQQWLEVVRQLLLDRKFEFVNFYPMAVDFMIALSDHHHIDYYEIAVTQLREMFELGLIDRDVRKDTACYLYDSEFYRKHCHIKEQLIGDVTQETQGWTNRETRAFAEKLRKDLTRQHLFEADMLKGVMPATSMNLMNLIASELEFIPSEIAKINYYEVAMNALNRLSIGEKGVSYEGRDRSSAKLYDSELYVRHQKLTQATSTKAVEEKEDKIMMKIETKHFVNGIDIVAFSTEQKIELIAETEGQLRHLDNIEIKSKMVAAELAKTEEFLVNINQLFDAAL